MIIDGEGTGVLDLGTGDEGGGGGNDGGGSGNGAGGGEGGGFDTFGAEGDQGDGGDGHEGDEGDGQGEGEGDRSGQPGRYGEKEFRTDLAKLKEVDPAIAKQFQRAFYKAAQVSRLGTIQELTNFKETLELHGGVDGINEMAEEVAQSRQLEQGFQKGDKAVLDGWAKDYPDGFKKLVLPAVDKLLAMDPAAWESGVGAPIATQFFEKFGVFDAIGQLGKAIRDNKPEDAARIYNDLVSKVLKPMQGLATTARQADPLGNDRRALEEKESEVLNKEQKLFYGGVRQDVNRIITTSINAQLRTRLNGQKISVDQGNKIRKEVNAELARIVNSDANYARQYKVVMGASDHDRAVKFITTRANSRVSKAVEIVLRDRNLLRREGSGGGNGNQNGNRVRRVTPGGSGTGSNSKGGVQTVNMRPKAGDVDFTRTEKASWLLSHGEAWGKDGRRYKW